MKGRTADEIMERGGFSANETGPFVTALREKTRMQVANGLLDRSPGTWGPEAAKVGAEGRAKALLASQWRIDMAHTCRIECIDPPIGWSFNTKTMWRSIRIRWRRLLPWFGDQGRRVGMRYRIWRDRHVVNPYE